MTSKKLAIYSAPKHDPGIRITAYEDYQHDEYKGPHIGSYPSVQENKVSLGLRKFRGRKKTLLLLRAMSSKNQLTTPITNRRLQLRSQ